MVNRDHQRPTEVISGHQWTLVAIRGNQRSSETISGHQGHQCGSPDALLPIGTVAAAPPDLPPVEMQSRRELRTSPDDGAADGLRHCPPPAAAEEAEEAEAEAEAEAETTSVCGLKL